MRHDEIIKEIERREYYNSMAPFPVYDTEVITDLKKLEMITSKDTSNNEPITFCKTCLSIHIKTVEFEDTDQAVDYCVACSNTDLETTHISEWEDMYEERYGERFLTERNK
jgi:hypothetical protein|tara:strand:- start:2276 stop:2608 length:333 start_codon:yes stop_codon:yes gene_type:complete